MSTSPSSPRSALYPDAPTADETLNAEERTHYKKVWARAARALHETLGAGLEERELTLVTDLMDAAFEAGRLSVPLPALPVPEPTPPGLPAQEARELTLEVTRLRADLAFQKEIGRIHPPRPRANLHRHFIKQIALPERYGLHLSLAEVEALQAQVPGTPPTTIVRGATGVTLNIQGHEVLCLLNACAEDGSPTLTTVYTPQMLRGTTNDIV